MKISTKGRYGLTIMIELAKKYGEGPVSLKSIAQANDLSEALFGTINFTIRNAGLVKSIRGAYGGYVLADHLETLHLGCYSCSRGAYYCRLKELKKKNLSKRQLWIRIRDAVKDVLDSTTIEDLANRKEEDEIDRICFIFNLLASSNSIMIKSEIRKRIDAKSSHLRG